MGKEKGHSFCVFLIREWVCRLRRELLTVKSFFLLLILGYMVFMMLFQEEGLSMNAAGIVGYWLLLVLRIRRGKLFYMLPLGYEEQKRYLFDSFIVSMLLLAGFMAGFGGIVTALMGRSCLDWWKSLVLQAVPMWLAGYGSIMMEQSRGARTNYGFFTTRRFIREDGRWEEYELSSVKGEYGSSDKKTPEEKREQRKAVVFYCIMNISIIVTMIYSMVGIDWNKQGVNFVAISALVFSYAWAVFSLSLAFREIFHDIDAAGRV